jgi:positive regulator of sigma E activity
MLGFGVNLVTGMLFVIAAADQYIGNTPFIWKIAFLMVAGANLLYLTVYDRIWELKAGQEPVLLDRAVAVSAVVVWMGVIYAGRMLPFLGNAF